MKSSNRSFAVVSPLFAVLLSLSIGTLNARDADLASRTFAAAQTAKRNCINTCRARYRDCRRLSQAPSFQCRDVYQDCTRYTCTGLGPGCRRWLLPPSGAAPYPRIADAAQCPQVATSRRPRQSRISFPTSILPRGDEMV